MRVLYFHQHFSTPRGATGTRSYEMSQTLIRAGHSVTMVCGTSAQGKTGIEGPFSKGFRRGFVDGIDVIELNLPYANQMGLTARLTTFAKFAIRSTLIALKEPTDLVFASSTPLTAGIPGIAARWLRRKTFVFEVRDLWPELPKAMGVINNPILLWLMSILEWISYKSANRLIGLSPGIVNGIVSAGIDVSRVQIIPNGCDLDLFSGAIDAWRPPNVRDDQLLAIFTGTHGQANGLDAVLDAAVVLKKRDRDDICFALVGEGSQKKRLKKRVCDEKIDNVIFLDPISKEKLPALMRGANIGLQIFQDVPAFYYGTSPNKFFDYISAGLPVLNNYPGWVAGLISDEDCGFLVAPNDPSDFADKMILASENRDTLKTMGSNARRLAEKHFDRKALSNIWVAWVTGT